ncbi:MAG: hypothetical protein HOF76_08175 [Candidatus Scalindua sp.]|nr:hypothetical protein [Candidatus Scalindua sp.]
MIMRIQNELVLKIIKFIAHRERKFLFLYFVMFCLLALTSISCTTLTVPEYEVPVIDKHTLVERHDNVVVAVFPMQDQNEQKIYFGSNLTDHGVLPIFLLVRNSSSRSYLLSSNQVQIDSTEKQTGRTEVVSDDMAYSVGAVGGALLSPALMVIGGKMLSNNSVVKHSLEKNKLRKTIVSPADVKCGFIYAPLQKGQKTMLITILLQDMESSLVTPYRFRINFNQ